MGFFGEFTYSDGQWNSAEQGAQYLRLSIHDSDIATVQYRPAASPAMGICYLGYEPREFFEDPSASAPVDTGAEAAGLASWALTVTGARVHPDVLHGLLAAEGREPEDVFVEETTRQLLRLLGLPLPPGLVAGA
jgi:hypothetical protein